MSGVGLFRAILAALGLGLVLAVFLQWILRRLIATNTAPAAPIDITKLALTTVAGVGGIVALVVAYRRQRDLEQGRFVERFGAAAAQLGANDVAVRIAGVYAMAGVADESPLGRRRQQCIDVLCGYLRLPYDPTQGSSGRTKLVVITPLNNGELDAGKQEEHVEYRQNDREVRRTIIRVIVDHLRTDVEFSWSASDFDFRTVTLEDVDFSNTRSSGNLRFDNATFSGDANFRNATFSGYGGFDNATFSGDANFTEATFSYGSFDNATFSGYTNFAGALLRGFSGFDNATFSSNANFTKAVFTTAAPRFDNATFSGDANFREATFSGYGGFDNATFSGDANFTEATFSRYTNFDGAMFCGHTSFYDTTSTQHVDFDGATFLEGQPDPGPDSHA